MVNYVRVVTTHDKKTNIKQANYSILVVIVLFLTLLLLLLLHCGYGRIPLTGTGIITYSPSGKLVAGRLAPAGSWATERCAA